VPRLRSTLAIAVALATLVLVPAGCGGEESADVEPRPEPERAGGDGAGADQRPDREGDRLAGAESVVFIGDSLAVAGEAPYPDRLETTLGRPLAVTNLAQAGTTTEDWLPGGALFEDRLRPELAGADIVFVTVGGTDLERALAGSDALNALEQAREGGGAAAIGGAFAAIERNLRRTFAAIEAVAPQAAIVFVGYPDYASSALWRERAGTLGTVALRSGLAAFGPIAERAGADETIEMLDATAPRIDSLLSDGEHLSDAGHELYAEEIAERLGG
jgi:lysophospholipase L1-like esterase